MERLEINTRAHSEFREITDEVQAAVKKSKIISGLAHVYIPHTTAGLTINENADPDVKADMIKSLDQLVPWNQPRFQHAEGNSAAHIKASMMGFNISVFIEDSALALGMWQGIYICEFDGPRTRQVWVKIDGK